LANFRQNKKILTFILGTDAVPFKEKKELEGRKNKGLSRNGKKRYIGRKEDDVRVNCFNVLPNGNRVSMIIKCIYPPRR
jgi:hypothetical protein